ncbi:MAG: transporter, partial [Bacteroidia bacterium]|nr:transporter [Bacteroidia bacterium]
MKKLIVLFIGLISMSTINAQNISDALRFSEDEIQGTARFRALSGAFGALGGDMSAVSINPAGSAVFNSSHASISLISSDKNNDVSYFNGFDSSSNSEIDINQFGIAIVLRNKSQNSDWNKIVFGFAYDRANDFDDDWFAFGTNTNSIDSYFLNNAQGLRLDEISAFQDETYTEAYEDIGQTFGYQNQQAFLGYESYILEPENDTDDNTVYFSNIAPGTFDQEFSYAARGYNG